MLATLGCLTIAANRYNHGFADAFGAQVVVIASAMNALVLGSTVSKGRRTEKTTERQSALLNSVGFAANQLLSMTDREETVTAVLQNLAVEAEMARTYVLENSPHSGASKQTLYEHWRSASPLAKEQSDILDTMLRDRINENATALAEGKVIQFRTVDLPENDQEVLASRSIRASIILPIFVDGHWWGCLGMDQSAADRPWPQMEVSAFKATGRVLAALLSHANVEQQFRQLTGNIPAVFWIAAPDGLEKTYVSPAYEQIWGWPYESILNNPRSWIAPVYHEDLRAYQCRRPETDARRIRRGISDRSIRPLGPMDSRNCVSSTGHIRSGQPHRGHRPGHTRVRRKLKRVFAQQAFCFHL